MFDLKELKLMFLDPTDLIINNINNYLSSNKTIKFIDDNYPKYISRSQNF